MRRQRSRPALAPAGEPTVAAGGGRHGGVDRGALARPARRGRGRRGRGRGGLPGLGSRGRGRRGAAIRAQPAARRGAARGGAARVRDERRAAATPARLSAATGGARLVRNDKRQVAGGDQRSRPALRGLPADTELSPAPDARRAGRGRDPGAATIADDSAGDPRLRHPRSRARSPASARCAGALGRASA